jgi:4-hydroxy-tetrahydrodipicolinate reductase
MSPGFRLSPCHAKPNPASTKPGGNGQAEKAGMEIMRIGVVGCSGRMGRTLLRLLAANPECAISGGSEAPGAPAIGQDIGVLAGLGDLGMAVGDDPVALFARSDAVIDFTTPTASAAHADVAARTGVALIVGTTGLNETQLAAIGHAAARTAIVHAPNMSMGVNVMLALVTRAAAVLDADYDIEIVEMHHRHKVDAPSGTALALGRAAATGRTVDLDTVAQKVRDGITGPRRRGDIGFATLRGGDVAGDHTVIFAGDGERIELTHKASSREVFARGAIKAALWARGKPPGLYAMTDVLGL